MDCPDCGGFVVELNGLILANASDQLQALEIVDPDAQFGAKVEHRGRLGDGYCRRKFYFWEISGQQVLNTTVIELSRSHVTV